MRRGLVSVSWSLFDDWQLLWLLVSYHLLELFSCEFDLNVWVSPSLLMLGRAPAAEGRVVGSPLPEHSIHPGHRACQSNPITWPERG